ncbi:hypothetical protein M9Y10_029008 [Tritrichomonas musculus]|uniref:RRM domain-containing protein n=1 Tax=Tritrichomonas musculus TaxID=1915356 RepID=A0ABR2KKW6_9EUKA
MNKYRYFIIPRFNPSYNIERLKDLNISKISSIHARYQEGKCCVVLVHTYTKHFEKEVRDSFQQLSTYKGYISIQEREVKSSTVYLLSTYLPHQKISGIKNLLNTFSEGCYRITPANKNSCSIYWRIDFKNIILAKHAINFFPNIPFGDDKIFVSSNPFDIPIIQFTEAALVQNYLNLNYERGSVEFLDRAFFPLEKRMSVALAKDNITARTIIMETNHSVIKKKSIRCQYYIDSTFMRYLYLYATKVETPDSFQDAREFYSQMEDFGPVFQVYVNTEGENSEFYVIFQSPKTLKKLFSTEIYACSFPKYSIYTIYNFPPNSNEKIVSMYLEKADITPCYIESFVESRILLPNFRIFIEKSDENAINSFFNSSDCIYENKTRPFCVQFLHEEEFESSCSQYINSSKTIQVPAINTKTISDVFNEYSRFGVINLIFYESKLSRYSITFNENSEYLKAKKYLESNFSAKNTIIIHKEKKAGLIISKKSNVIQITKAAGQSNLLSLPFLFNSDDEDYQNDIISRDSSLTTSPTQSQSESFDYILPPPPEPTIFNIQQSYKTTEQRKGSKSSKRNIKKNDQCSTDDEGIEEEEGSDKEPNFISQKPTKLANIFIQNCAENENDTETNQNRVKKVKKRIIKKRTVISSKAVRNRRNTIDSENDDEEEDSNFQTGFKNQARSNKKSRKINTQNDGQEIKIIKKKKVIKKSPIKRNIEESDDDDEDIIFVQTKSSRKQGKVNGVSNLINENTFNMRGSNQKIFTRKQIEIEEDNDENEVTRVPPRSSSKTAKKATNKNIIISKKKKSNETDENNDKTLYIPAKSNQKPVIIEFNKKSSMKNEMPEEEDKNENVEEYDYDNDDDDDEIPYVPPKPNKKPVKKVIKKKIITKKKIKNETDEEEEDENDEISFPPARSNRKPTKKIVYKKVSKRRKVNEEDDDEEDEENNTKKFRKSQKSNSKPSFSSNKLEENTILTKSAPQAFEGQDDQSDYDDDEDDEFIFVVNNKVGSNPFSQGSNTQSCAKNSNNYNVDVDVDDNFNDDVDDNFNDAVDDNFNDAVDDNFNDDVDDDDVDDDDDDFDDNFNDDYDVE